MHARGEDGAGQRDGVQEVLGGARRGPVHGRPRLGQEVLDDHLLDVAVPFVGGGDGLQGGGAVGPGLADADQDPRGERDAQPAGRLEGVEPASRRLVRGAAVGLEIPAQRLDHHPLAGRHRAQGGQLVGEERPGVGVGQQAGLFHDQAAHGDQVVDGGGVPVLGQPRPRHRVALLRPLAQGEERFVAADLGPPPGHVEHLVGRHVGRVDPGRGLGERAVAAAVAAEHRQRDEDLGRESDPGAVGTVADGPGLLQQSAAAGAPLVVHRPCTLPGPRPYGSTLRSCSVPARS